MSATYDAGEGASVDRAKKSAKDRGTLKRIALRDLMASPEGRMWMHDLLESCGPFRTPFSRDPIQMSYNCGEATVGLKLIAELHEASTDLYLLMMKEANDGRTGTDSRSEPSTGSNTDASPGTEPDADSVA